MTLNTNWHNYKASYYTFAENGTRTASGIPFSNNKFTAASNKYPLGGIVLVASKEDTIIVVITDRINKRFGSTRIDLSPIAFKQLSPLHKGLIKVKTKLLWTQN